MTKNKLIANDAEMIKFHRNKLLKIDKDIIRLLGKRMRLTSKIGVLKQKNNLDIEQIEFWNQSTKKRKKMSETYNVNTSFIEELFLLIQKESIKIQTTELKNDRK